MTLFNLARGSGLAALAGDGDGDDLLSASAMERETAATPARAMRAVRGRVWTSGGGRLEVRTPVAERGMRLQEFQVRHVGGCCYTLLLSLLVA